MGNRPKPAAQRRAEGNPGKRPIPNEPELPAGEPVMPEWIRTSDAARAEWLRTVDILRDEGRLTPAFGPYLEKLAGAYDSWQRWFTLAKDAPDYLLVEKTRADGSHYDDLKIHPAHVQERQTREAYRRTLNDGCLSPATHARARVIAKPDANQQRKARLFKIAG